MNSTTRASFNQITTLQRMWFTPDAKHLAYLPLENNRIESYELDILKLLSESEVDYLFVAPSRPLAAKLGMPFEYRIPVQSKLGGVKCTLQSGPKGMTVSASGQIKWNVPADFLESNLKLLVEITDDSNRSMFYSPKLVLPEVIELAKMKAAELVKTEALAMKRVELRKRLEREKLLSAKLQSEGQHALQSINIASSIGIKKLRQVTQPAFLRKWVDDSGNEIEATLQEQFAGVANLRTPAGNTFPAPISRLSPDDQAFLKKMTAEAVKNRKSGTSHDSKLTMQYLGRPIAQLGRLHSRVVPTTLPKLSWRVRVLPLIGGKALYDLFDHQIPWDSKHNKRLIPMIPDLFRAAGIPTGKGKTCFLAVEGEEAGYNKGQFVDFRQHRDGIQNSIIVIEVPVDEAQVWTKPAEWSVDREAEILFQNRLTLHVILGNGTVKVVNKSEMEYLPHAFHISDGKTFPFPEGR